MPHLVCHPRWRQVVASPLVDRVIHLGVLRIAYLAMFHRSGYSYILSPAAQVVRQLIADFEHIPSVVDDVVLEVNSISPLPKSPIEFQRVSGAPAIMVIVRLTADTTRYYATFLPYPQVPPEQVLNVLCSGRERAKPVRRTSRERTAGPLVAGYECAMSKRRRWHVLGGRSHRAGPRRRCCRYSRQGLT